MFYNIQYNIYTHKHTHTHILDTEYIWGFPGGSAAKNLTAMQQTTCNPNLRDVCSIPASGRCLGEANGLPITIFLPEKSQGQMSLAGYSLWAYKVGQNLVAKPPPPQIICIHYICTHTYICRYICVCTYIYIERERKRKNIYAKLELSI